MKLFDKLCEDGISRRGLMKSFAAIGAANALYGCSKSDTEYVGTEGGGLALNPDPEPPKIVEEDFGGMLPHNCGGSCLTRAYVRNGVIKRVASDETPEKHFLAPKYSDEYGDFIQNRNCPRCRSTVSYVYSTNRLMYPMIQTKERGDLSGFKRVTWEEAAKYFKAKTDYVRDNWGPASYQPNGTGAWGAEDFRGPDLYLGMSTNGGNGIHPIGHRDTYSWPIFPFIAKMTGVRGGQPPSGDNWIHMMNCDELVLWSVNFAENGMTEQAGWYLKQFRELGKKITVIESRFNQTAVSIADKFLPVVQGTDGAMALAVMYCMLTEYREDLYKLYEIDPSDPDKDGKLRREVGRWIYGFFDTNSADDMHGTNDTYQPDATINHALFRNVHKVGPGMSFSAYLRGTETDPCNMAASSYPNDIGYHTSAPEQFPNMVTDPAAPTSDRLHGKRTKCYGQVPKTPEWAAKICGVKADDIRELAKKLLTKNVIVTMSGGIQRNSEAEGLCWSLYIMNYFARCFGVAGRNFGRPAQRQLMTSYIPNHNWSIGVDISPFKNLIDNRFVYDPVTSPDGYLNAAKTAAHDEKKKRLTDAGLRTFGSSFGEHSSGTVALQNWMDMVEAANSTKTYADPMGRRGSVKPSRWGNAQVQGVYSPIKIIRSCFAASVLNQSCDTNHAVRVFTAKDSSLVNTNEAIPGIQMNPNGYKIEFMWTHDCVMTPVARWSDLVLPGTSAFERFQIGNSSREDGNKRSFTHKLIDPPGEALPEIAMAGQIAKAYGVEDEYYTRSGTNWKGSGKDIFEQAADFEYKVWASRFTGNPAGMTMKEWAKLGIYKDYKDALEQPLPAVVDKAWREDPENNRRASVSGRVEAYCISMMEFYESNHFNNLDRTVTLGNNNELYSKNIAPGDLKYGRLVYPIPMYIPIAEGIHADSSHPDPMGLDAEGYTNQLMCWHPMIRSHATFASVPMLCELKYWKRNAKGEPTYPNRKITNLNAGADHFNLKDTDITAPSVWVDDVYETAWINPKTKYHDGSDIKEGDLVVVESLRGKIIVSAHLSERVRPKMLGIAQGSWYDPIDHPVHGNIDRGGNVNTLFSTRGSRVNQATTMSCDCRVKLVKYVPVGN